MHYVYCLLLPGNIIQSSIHSFSKYFLNLYHVLGTIPGAGRYISNEKAKKDSVHMELAVLCREAKRNQINKLPTISEHNYYEKKEKGEQDKGSGRPAMGRGIRLH